jgi:CHAT domain-containing protein
LVTSTKDLIARGRKAAVVKQATLIGYPAYNNLSNQKDTAFAGGVLSSNRGEEPGSWLRGGKITELPGTKAEVTGIARLLRERKVAVDTLTGVRATEAALKRVNNPQVLHIATHGFFRANTINSQETIIRDIGIKVHAQPYDPLLNAGLLLAGCQAVFTGEKGAGTAEDGVLTAYEAMNLNLDKTDLVILSACQTGLGDVKNGEGVYGLQRAFQIAGAKAVLMSLWKVDDKVTQLLMQSFYTYWLTSGDLRMAFSKAQHEIREQYPQPFFWGAFVLLSE